MGRRGKAYRPLVMVSVGGGPAVPVLLDTGSSPLMLAAGAAGPGVHDTGRTGAVHYGSQKSPSVNYKEANAVVSFPGTDITTPKPIKVGIVNENATTRESLSGAYGAQGIMGIALGGASPKMPDLLSVLTQLGAPYSDGYTVALSSHAGTVTLGAPKPTASSVVLPLTKANGTYPDGRQAWERGVNLCWQAGPAHSCGPVTVDTGAPTGAVYASGRVPQQNGMVAPGTHVTLSAPNGGPPLEDWTVSSDLTTHARVSVRPGGNSGIRFFFFNTVGFNRITGQAVITPTHASGLTRH